MEAYERIIKLIEYLKLNKNSFSEEIGMSSNVTIGRIINENRNPHQDTLKKIVDRFPQVNYDWLKTGEGEMFNNNQTIENVNGSGIVGNNVNGGGINDSAIIEGLLKTINKRDEQMDKLLSIIEKISNK
jgi:hypothetical protein